MTAEADSHSLWNKIDDTDPYVTDFTVQKSEILTIKRYK